MGGREMKERRSKAALQGFTGPLWDDCPRNYAESVALEELVKASYENPDNFREEWLNPLLAEGLNVDGIFEVLLVGTTRPN
jgi:hypothetical protein